MTTNRKNGHFVGIRRAALAAYLISLISLPAVADTSFAYQGVLRDELGNRIAADQAKITFRLYDAATEGTQLWEKELNLAIDTNGLFNAELTGSDLADTIATAQNQGKTIYVGLTVAGSAGEITPRQKMIPTPLASYAQNVANANGDFTVEGTAYFKGAVSMQTSNTVLNAQSISAAGTLNVTGPAVLRGGSELQGNVTVGNSLTVNGVQMSMPVGSIIMWAGEATDLPADGCWAICDGQTEYTFNGTKRKVPDLRGRFIVGVGTAASGTNYVAGATGGEETHKLTVDEMPSHTHSLSGVETMVDNQHDYYVKHLGWEKGNHKSDDTSHDPQGDGDNYPAEKKYTVNTSSTGSGAAHENRPPYYALCYIIKIK